MALEVRMPQMGESVTEGTILKWLVKEGDSVEKDQPLFEISTDKVDAEIPSPAAGVLARILAAEGTTVEVGAVVAELAGAGDEQGRSLEAASRKSDRAGGAGAAPAGAAPGNAAGSARAPGKAAAPAKPSVRPPAAKARAAGTPAQEAGPAPAAPARGVGGAGGVPVVMPQMGESIAEGTIIKWLVKVGDPVEKDAPLFEISTDKVDAEIPSPESGVLTEILVGEGETVEVGRPVARIGGAAGAAAAGAPAAKAPAAEAPAAAAPSPRAPAARVPAARAPSPRAPAAEAAAAGPTVPGRAPLASAPPPPGTPPHAGDVRSSPIARRIAREHGIDLASISGTGREGRVSKKDVLALVEAGGAPRSGPAVEGPRITTAAPSPGAGRAVPPSGMPGAAEPPAEALHMMFPAGEDAVVRPMSIMRRKIAEHMVASKQTSPHVLTVFEIDVTKAERVRAARKDEFESRHGARLTLTTIAIHSIIPAILRFPVLNASVSGDSIVYHRGINVGVAVALEDGLIVPVIKGAERLGIGEIARALQSLAGRARAKKLVPEDVQGATFTITNPGPYGALFGFPVINQPNVAILGIGGAKKRPVVIDDAIAIRDVAYFALSFDHRAVDGAVADQFMSAFKERIEGFSEEVLA